MKDNKLEEILEYHLGYNPARHNLADIKNDLEELYISKEEARKLFQEPHTLDEFIHRYFELIK